MALLIYKDFYQVRKPIRQLLIIWLIAAAFAIAANADFGQTLVYTYGFVFIYSIMARILYTEDKNRGLYFMRTLPLKPSLIVGGKFLSGLVLVAAMIALTTAFMLTSAAIQHQPQYLADNMFIIAIIATAGLIYCGLYLFAFFNWGYAKATQYIVAAIFAVFFLSMLLPTLLKGIISGKAIIDFLNSLTHSYMLVLSIMAALLIYLVCYWGAAKAFKRKKDMWHALI